MTTDHSPLPFKLFCTCPQFMRPEENTSAVEGAYIEHAVNSARWGERHGFDGMLIYADNRQLDGWLLTELVIQATERFLPLIATQPIYMHPYTVAKKIATIAYLHNRQIFLNMIAGGFKGDLEALNDTTPHDARYDRLAEYSLVIKELLAAKARYSFDGDYYKLTNVTMTPPVPEAIQPQFFVSGSSDAGLESSRRIGATAIQYPAPSGEYEAPPADIVSGIRVGVIARETKEEAWEVALARFPKDRKGAIAHQLAMKVSDSEWHKNISELAEREQDEARPYWLTPYRHYKTFCPYLVGDYETVAQDLARYVQTNVSVFITDILPSEEEAAHTRTAFEHAAAIQA